MKKLVCDSSTESVPFILEKNADFKELSLNDVQKYLYTDTVETTPFFLLLLVHTQLTISIKNSVKENNTQEESEPSVSNIDGEEEKSEEAGGLDGQEAVLTGYDKYEYSPVHFASPSINSREVNRHNIMNSINGTTMVDMFTKSDDATDTMNQIPYVSPYCVERLEKIDSEGKTCTDVVDESLHDYKASVRVKSIIGVHNSSCESFAKEVSPYDVMRLYENLMVSFVFCIFALKTFRQNDSEETYFCLKSMLNI